MTDGIGGMGGVQNALNSVAQQIGDTGKIVRDVYEALDQFKKETDRAIRQETLQKIREDLERLRGIVGNLGSGGMMGTLGSAIDQIQEGLDSARISSGQGDTDALQVIQQTIDDLRDRLRGMPPA